MLKIAYLVEIFNLKNVNLRCFLSVYSVKKHKHKIINFKKHKTATEKSIMQKSPIGIRKNKLCYLLGSESS